MKLQYRLLLCFLLVFSFSQAQAQKQKTCKVLFVGNSYVYVNNLPLICSQVAKSLGITLIADNVSIGGYTLQEHINDTNSIKKIKEGIWDMVVLQEQSVLPAMPDSAVEKDMFPFAQKLGKLIKEYNPKSKTVFYMTWGRKNGLAEKCAENPVFCYYNSMDSLIAIRYKEMAKQNHADLSPVSAVWKYIRTNYPAVELYDEDESHPSEAGTYAAACCFCTIFFGKNPALIKYNDSLNITVAQDIRNAVTKIVFEHLPEWQVRNNK